MRLIKPTRYSPQVAGLLLALCLCFFLPVAGAFAGFSATPANGAGAAHDWVVDNAHILSNQTIYRLTHNTVELERRTTDQFVVMTVDDLGGRAIEDYALWIANTWGIGQRDKNNGVLLLVAPRERKVRIEVGDGLEKTLTRELCQRIIDNDIIPSFKNGEMEQGVIGGANAIIEALDGTYDPLMHEPLWETIWIYLAVAGIAAVFGSYSLPFTGGGGSFSGGGGATGSW